MRPTIHVVRSIIDVLVDRKVDHLDEMISALRKMERDIDEVVGALQQVIHLGDRRPSALVLERIATLCGISVNQVIYDACATLAARRIFRETPS